MLAFDTHLAHIRGAIDIDDANTLAGNQGNDQVEGRAGNDALNGGGRAGAFYFGSGFGSDVIWDYALSATAADSEKIFLCLGASATHTFGSNADGHVVVNVVGLDITLFGIGATDSARVNLIKRDATHSDCSGFAAPAPLRVWFIDDIPKFSKGRYFATININRPANVLSYFEGESVNSPLNTLVSLESDHSYGVATPNP